MIRDNRSKRWWAWMKRTVPVRERITTVWVSAPSGDVAHPVEQFAGGHAGGGEEDVVGVDQIAQADHPLEVESGFGGVLSAPRRPAATAGTASRRRDSAGRTLR